MHRLAVFFLLLWLPLQVVWAAAAPYCQHESAPAAAHFGHHAHQHEAAGGDTPATPGGEHGDCDACHGACTAPPVAGGLLQADFGRPEHALGQLRALPSPPPSPPERPDWHPLA